MRPIHPAARKIVKSDGAVISLIKPHYEAEPAQLRKGILPAEHLQSILELVKSDVENSGFSLVNTTLSPIKGAKGNTEVLAWLAPTARAPARPTASAG